MNRELVITGMRLFLICAVAVVSLGVINEFTEPRIIQRKVEEEKQALAVLVSEGEVGEKVPVEGEGTVRAYYPIRRGGSQAGYVLELQGVGYGGEMKILAAYESSGEILAARLLENNETPGLGKKAEDPAYMDRFRGTGAAERPVPTSKEMLGGQAAPAGKGRVRQEASFATWLFGRQSEGGGADSITGATVTFLGVSRALADGAAYMRERRGGK